MSQIYTLLLLLVFVSHRHYEPEKFATKKVMIIRSYNGLLDLPNRRKGQGDFTRDFISFFPPMPGVLKSVVLGDYLSKMENSKIFAWDLDRNAYLTILTRYQIPYASVNNTKVLPERLPEPITYYRLKEKPVTIQLWTADAICKKYVKSEGGKAIDSIFIVKSLNNIRPLEQFNDATFCDVQWSIAN